MIKVIGFLVFAVVMGLCIVGGLTKEDSKCEKC